MKPDQILKDMAKMFKERQKVYGDNWLMIGHVLEQMFPNGLVLNTADDFNRFHLFLMAQVKLTRLANTKINHQDSARDAGVYSAMLESLISLGICERIDDVE